MIEKGCSQDANKAVRHSTCISKTTTTTTTKLQLKKKSCQVSGLKGLLWLALLCFLCGPLKGLKPKVN